MIRPRVTLILCAALAGCSTPGLKLDAPYVSTPQPVVDAMLALVDAMPEDWSRPFCGFARFFELCRASTGHGLPTAYVASVGGTGVATINHATGANTNSQFAVPFQGDMTLSINGGNTVVYYDGANTRWRAL